MGVQIADDRLLAGEHLAARDEDGDRVLAGGADELGAALPRDRHLPDDVGEAELGQALAHAVRCRTPFGLPEFELCR